MHLVQILLPLSDNDGQPFARGEYEEVRQTLTERFGGVTAYVRAPAEGHWKEDEGSTTRDEIVIYEVMAERLDRAWWAEYRERLRVQFRQEELVVRATAVELL
jgi:hypothetical protein